MIKISRLFIILISFGSIYSQNNLDSLKRVLEKKSIHDTTRLSTISLIFENIYDNDEITKYNDLLGKIAKKNLAKKNINPILFKKYTFYLADHYNNISVALEEKGDPNSLKFLDKSIVLYRSINAKDEIYTSIVGKGLLLSRRKKYNEAINCYFEALKYFELNKKDNADGLSYANLNLGILYGEQGQWEIGIVHLKKAIYYINKKAKINSPEDELLKFAMYYNIGSGYTTLKNYDEGQKYLNAGLIISKKYNQNSLTSFALGKLGLIDIETNKLDAAEKKLIEANLLSESKISKSFTMIYLGEVYLKKGNLDKAQNLIEEGMMLSKSINYNDLQEHSRKLLYELFKRKGDFKKSLSMLELYHQIKDSVNVEANKRELKQQLEKYNFEKKEFHYKLNAQKKENRAKSEMLWLSLLLFFILIVLFIILIGSYFLYRKYQQKQVKSDKM